MGVEVVLLMDDTLSLIGEFGLIERINRLLIEKGIRPPGLTLGIGDDTACFRHEPGYEVVMTCDAMVEGRHFPASRIKFRELGRRAMVSNISDIGAMGGIPRYALVSLGLRKDTAIKEVEEMYLGFLEELNPLGAAIVGGNITSVDGALFVDITLAGHVESENLVRRSTARVGDYIVVTGYPGQAAAGLQMLLTGEGTEDLRDNPLVRAYVTPGHRAREGRAVAESGYATAMIDTSDGLLGDLGHICEESKVGAELVEEALPVSEELYSWAVTMDCSPYELILGKSDDYELIITCRPDDMHALRSSIAGFGPVPVAKIGTIVDPSEGLELVRYNGTRKALRPEGWDHFLPGD